jgi:hypothetical protein
MQKAGQKCMKKVNIVIKKLYNIKKAKLLIKKE